MLGLGLAGVLARSLVGVCRVGSVGAAGLAVGRLVVLGVCGWLCSRGSSRLRLGERGRSDGGRKQVGREKGIGRVWIGGKEDAELADCLGRASSVRSLLFGSCRDRGGCGIVPLCSSRFACCLRSSVGVVCRGPGAWLRCSAVWWVPVRVPAVCGSGVRWLGVVPRWLAGIVPFLVGLALGGALVSFWCRRLVCF